MVPVLLSILLVVLMSGAVLWVVAGDLAQPTSDAATPVATPPGDGSPLAPSLEPRRRPATSRRRPSVTVPAETAGTPAATTAFRSAPLPRHRVRSSVLLVLLAVTVGVVVAAVIAVVVVMLAFAVRSAVTS